MCHRHIQVSVKGVEHSTQLARSLRLMILSCVNRGCVNRLCIVAMKRPDRHKSRNTRSGVWVQRILSVRAGRAQGNCLSVEVGMERGS